MNVLLIQIRQLGDVLLTTPLARVIKEGISGARVVFLTGDKAVGVLKGNPWIDEIMTIGGSVLGECLTIKRVVGKFDAVIDVQRTGRSSRVTLFSLAKLRIAFYKKSSNFYYNRLVHWREHGYTPLERMELLKPLGIREPVRDILPEIFYNDSEFSCVKGMLKDVGADEFFVVAPTSRRPGKRWPIRNFRKLSEILWDKTRLMPVVVYGPGEKSYVDSGFTGCGSCYVLGRTLSIGELAALIDMSAFVISNDSFPAHVAVARRKRLFVVLGPTEGWYPKRDFVLELRKGLECQPCRDERSCPFGFRCLAGFSPEEVLELVGPALDL